MAATPSWSANVSGGERGAESVGCTPDGHGVGEVLHLQRYDEIALDDQEVGGGTRDQVHGNGRRR